MPTGAFWGGGGGGRHGPSRRLREEYPAATAHGRLGNWRIWFQHTGFLIRGLQGEWVGMTLYSGSKKVSGSYGWGKWAGLCGTGNEVGWK